MAVTINDVAKTAGVSIATVSRVINGKSTVNQSLQKRVKDAVEALGYVPNFNAHALKQDCSKLIGMTASDLSVSFFPELVKRIEKAFLPAGYATIVSSTYDLPLSERMILDHMLARRVDVLLANSTGLNEDRLAQIRDCNIPLILYDRRSRDHDFPSVYVDKHRAVYQAMEHLFDLGHRSIALMTGPEWLTSNEDRLSGFQSFLGDRMLKSEDCPALFGEFSEEYGFAQMDELLAQARRPTAIITGSISITAGILRCCRSRGLTIPDDLALVSMGNFSYGDVVGLELTCMDNCVSELSDGIIHLLSRVFQGERLCADDQIVIKPRLCVGQSTVKKP